jgi:hypothetical protein
MPGFFRPSAMGDCAAVFRHRRGHTVKEAKLSFGAGEAVDKMAGARERLPRLENSV